MAKRSVSHDGNFCGAAIRLRPDDDLGEMTAQSEEFDIVDVIDRGPRSILYRAVRKRDSRSVVLKVLNGSQALPQDLEHLERVGLT